MISSVICCFVINKFKGIISGGVITIISSIIYIVVMNEVLSIMSEGMYK